MGDYNFGGSDEENAELKKLNAEVVCELRRSNYGDETMSNDSSNI